MMEYIYGKSCLERVPMPECDNSGSPVFLTDETMIERQKKILNLMSKYELDTIIIYGDLEHGSNFEYLTGFLPRFEESLLILHQDGNAYLVLGNENIKMVKYSRIPAKLIHAPHFSLPNQSMNNKESIKELLEFTGIKTGTRVGIVGWKNFTSPVEDNQKLFDIPYYILDAIKKIVGDTVRNATHIFISGDDGARTVNNANEITHYEFGSSLASDCVLTAMNEIEVGKTEMELADYLNRYGQPTNVITICSAGERFYKANLYPTNKRVSLGDEISITVGYKGGLSSRKGYAVNDAKELSDGVKDYIEKIAAPYFTALVAWLENIHIGLTGDNMYRLVDTVLPKEKYNWSLNPGHLTSDEEWMSSPIFSGSTQILKSGMLLQLDIIPSIPGYGGVGAENGIALADESLQKNIKIEYPEMWKRIQKRRSYIKNYLGIRLNKDVLPLSSTVGYFRPYMLNKNAALVYKN